MKNKSKGPIVKHTKARRYAWCPCGITTREPFCDGSHSGSGYKAFPVDVEQAGIKAWCTYKRTATPPFCDGTHK
ncbi:MAG: CDGSH iron-sulfur domain-containing protein [Bacteroidota bacterium]|nr:CDGSH iron-sulfur domain-containing protein [Bacteroidota bacterium]